MFQLDSTPTRFSFSTCFHDETDLDIADALTPVSKKFKRHSERDFDDLKQEMQTTPKMFGLRRCVSYDETRKYRKMLHPSAQRKLNMDTSAAQSVQQFQKRVMRTLDNMSENSDLIGDGSTNHRLPITTDKHKDLKYISSETMMRLLKGEYPEIGNYTIIDCRYPYEFEGGHIQGAINLHTKQMITEFLKNNSANSQRTVLVFHCEFSSKRGPKLLRHLRGEDRAMNVENYPALCFPEIYLLDGGYQAFFTNNKKLCFPQSYTPMLHKDHSSELRHFRSKSKSCMARISLEKGKSLRF